MIVKPKTRGFICTTAHPVGCAENIRNQVDYIKSQQGVGCPPRVLVIGSSTGYGLACRLTAAFLGGASTVGVFFEKEASGNRTATAGYYNNAAFEKLAGESSLIFHSINGDAFSDDIKAQTIEAIKQLPGGKVDLVIYSLASPKRVDPKTGQVYNSVIKPINAVYSSKTVDFHSGEVTGVEISPATEQEIEETIKVMGGDDWLLWMDALLAADALAPNAATVAFSYIGPTLTHPVYKDGTIGRAKDDLQAAQQKLDSLLKPLGGKAFVSVNKALVTQASSAIPVVPLYIAMLYKLMKENNTHEDCTQQMVRLFKRLYPNKDGAIDWNSIPVDDNGRIRMDDLEMKPEIQDQIPQLWEAVSSENVNTLTDLGGYHDAFFSLFGFGVDGVDYSADVEI